jgi:hypothetical protein
MEKNTYPNCIGKVHKINANSKILALAPNKQRHEPCTHLQLKSHLSTNRRGNKKPDHN